MHEPNSTEPVKGGRERGASAPVTLLLPKTCYGHSGVPTQRSIQHFGALVGHVPHETCWPQLFNRVPQTWSALLQRVCVSVGVQPHWFGTPPPPQVSGAVQEPQSSVPPEPYMPLHPSGIDPQAAPCAAHVVGTQFVVGPPRTARANCPSLLSPNTEGPEM